MLSLDRGKPIGIVQNGRLNGSILNIYDPDKKCCEKCSDKCGIRSKYCCNKCSGAGGCLRCNIEPDINYNDPFDIIDEDFIRRNKKKMSSEEMDIIRKSLKNRVEPIKNELKNIYGSSMNEIKERSKREFFVNDEGSFQPSPNYQESERIYVAGPSGSGKTRYVSNYVKEWIKLPKNKHIFLFSDVEKDEELDKYDQIKRIILNEDLAENPLRSTDFPNNSLIIFDDIDSIMNKKIFKVVEELINHLLRRGRHENLSVIVTSHMLSDYMKTRVILNEATSLTIFPKSGSSHSIRYTLQKYGGLNKDEINKIMGLNSRWVTLHLGYPKYVMYSKGVYLL